MYLKGIEVSGFKSFARKTEFQFQDGITGIVGPNGSGKSNIADAMRWVLGEQSAKQLRSSSMQDVIFAGTENRRAQGYAYVNIIFDNTDHRLPIDYDEVTIGRRVYRSGESEYLINSNSCRLKDIQELFYDTGIGKEGYSIIGQGQIDKILSGKPEERRELFDEAAGIVKFKKRKNEALNRLAKEEESLVRIQDILSELTRQEEPLRIQAEKARRYLNLHDELKGCEVQEFLADSSLSREQMKGLKESYEISSAQLSEVQKQAGRLKDRYQLLNSRFTQLESQIEQLRLKQEQKKDNQREMQSETAILKSKQDGDLANQKRYQELQESLQAKLAELVKEQETLILEAKALEEQENSQILVSEEIETVLQELVQRQAVLEGAIKEKQNQENNLVQEKSKLMVERQRYDTMSEQTILKEAELSGKLLSAKAQAEDARMNLRKGKAQLKQWEEKIADCRERQKTTAAKQQKTAALLQQIRTEADQKRNGLHQIRARFDSLQNLAERYEGFGGSVRRLMENKRQFSGIHGVLAELIHVDKRYETAIETALGGSLQNIVTDHEQTAKQCIEYLKQNRYGRATFLPLTTIKPKAAFTEQDALTCPGVCGTADTLVQIPDRYRGIIRFLLGRILVVDTMDHALAVASRYRYSFRIVTLDGESLNAGGSISGGAYKNNSNLLGRRRELEDLEKQAMEAQEDWRQTQQKAEETQKQLEELGRLYQSLEKEMQEYQLSFSRTEMELRQGRDQLDSAKDELQYLEEESAKLLKEKKLFHQNFENAMQSAEETDTKLAECRTAAEQLQRELEEVKTSISSRQEQKVSGEIAKASFHEKKLHLKENQLRISQEQFANEQQRQAALEETAQWERVSTLRRQRIAELTDELAEVSEVLERISSDIAEKSQLREKITAEQQELFKKQESFSEEIQNLEKECLRITHQQEQLESAMERSAAYLWEEYQLTPSEAECYPVKAEPDGRNLKIHIQSLKNEIRALGSINTNAVEEFAELSERLTFMRTQYDDLVKARENLQILIEQLDDGMQKQFAEKFERIQQEFDKVFKELFGGGYGRLELSEMENTLESGILIQVQPPGKKLQNMMQLSGGEKALTAIALLFAIQNMKPSPFCILDEIEAALDDANVDRFADYLNKLKVNTQFIVITHRRGTMLIADQLYGITMQEKGISSLVSVDLTS